MAADTAPPAPQALLLDAGGHTCVAWWHAPAAAARARAAPGLALAVVLAGSWGDEDLAGYDGLRALAIQLAECGLATLRFEWPDTGDSSAATGAASIAAALAAFDAAATRALALSGCERLAFVGQRLGALLAAHAAVARQDVDALVALMPVADGRAFVREQHAPPVRAQARAAMPAPGATFDAAELPVPLGGFTQPVRHLEALATLKWPSAATTATLEALLLWPAQAPVRAAADALARMGVRVHERARADLSAVPAGHRLAPAAALEIVSWLQERAADATVTRGVAAIEDFGVADAGNAHANAAWAAARLEAATAAVLALSAGDAPVWMRLRAGGVAVRERIVHIGADDASNAPTLAGVLSERDTAAHDGAPSPSRRAILLLSAGRERRIGPRRMWVPWARHRAAAGDVVLRLDIAGSGDSDGPAARGGHGDRGNAVAHAVDWLRREHGVGPCIVMGMRGALGVVAVQQVILIHPASWHARMCALVRGAARHGMRLVRGGRVDIREISHGAPTFAGAVGGAELHARLDALLGPAPATVSRPATAASPAPRAATT